MTHSLLNLFHSWSSDQKAVGKNQALDQLHYGTAFRHAAATPLSSLLINLELIEQHQALKKSTYLQDAVDSAHRLKKLFRLNQSNQNNNEPETFLVKLALQSAFKLVRPLAQQVVIRSHLVFPDQLRLRGNKFCFQEAVICILKNALEAYDASHKNKNRVILVTGRREKMETNQPKLKLSFVDGGVGLAWWERSLVFAEGYTTKETGTGFGLVWVKKVIEDHLQGEIELKSRKEKGTTVSWHLPLG